jgi:sulfate adenylyltransferase
VSDHLIAPHGGKLAELLVDPERAAELRLASRDWPSWDLTPRQLCDLELLLNGGFSPLRGFLTRRDYEAVCATMRLADGTLWPVPVVLDVPEAVAVTLGAGASLALRDPEGVPLAVLRVDDVWRPDRDAEARAVYGTTDREHPGVAHLLIGRTPGSSAGAWRGSSFPSTTTSARCASRRRRCEPSSGAWAGAGWWRSRRATRCTGRTRS